LTYEEVNTIHEMVASTENCHLNPTGLAWLAQRLGKVYASPTSWYRLIRRHGWKRPRQRVYSAKRKVGIRATQTNAVWHIDTSIIRLLDGKRAYLYAVIDNFSRRILSWRVTDSFDPTVPAQLLQQASQGIHPTVPQVITDSGVENRNPSINALIESGVLTRILAQVNVTFSNSMIESWWRMLKHQWLYLNELDSVESVRKLVKFYVEQYNSVVPHPRFEGRTPDEVYFENGSDVPKQLEDARRAARKARQEVNRARTCDSCRKVPELVPLHPQKPNSS
jgi:putative transposase